MDITCVQLVDASVRRALLNSRRLRQLQRHVDRNLCEPLSLAKAAQIVCLERTYFSKYFRSSTGWTFSGWNRAVRIERAAMLLHDRQLPVLAISLAVGYANLSTFERAFKKFVGHSPSAYRIEVLLSAQGSWPSCDAPS